MTGCTCPNGCLCTRCPVCRLKRVDPDGNLVGDDEPGITLANAYGRDLSHDDVVRAMREEDVEAELETQTVGEPEGAKWGDEPDPNAWGLHPVPVDREQVVAQTEDVDVGRDVLALIDRDRDLAAFDDRGFRVTVELLPDEGDAAPEPERDDEVERKTTWT